MQQSEDRTESMNFLDLNHLIILQSYSEMHKQLQKSRPVHVA